MLETKQNNVSLYAQRASLVSDTAVCMGFQADINSCALNRLLSHWCCSNITSCEETCVAYAVYLNVANLLCGDPVAIKNSKVSSIKCGAHNGRFFITWKTKGNISSVRKSLGLAFKALVPGKVYSTYINLMRVFGQKSNREVFNWASQQLINSINTGLFIGIIGNIKADQEHLKTLLEVAIKKLNVGQSKKLSKPASIMTSTSCNHDDVVEISVLGWKAHLLKDYILSKAKGLTPVVCDKSIIIPINKTLWDTLKKKLKNAVEDHIKNRYSKTGGELGNLIAYLALSHGTVSCSDVKTLLKSSVTAAQLIDALKTLL